MKLPAGPAIHRLARMGAPRGRRHARRRHHRPRAGAARRHRVRRGAAARPQGRRPARPCGVVESVKAASDIYAPVAGEVVAANDGAGARPGEGQRGRLRRVDVPHQARQSGRRRRAPRRRRLREGRSFLKPPEDPMPDTPLRHAAAARARPSSRTTPRSRAATSAPTPRSRPRCSPRSASPRAPRSSTRSIPAAIRRKSPMGLGAPRTEGNALAALRRIAAKNRVFKSFIGQGYYDTHTPGVILRNVLREPRLVHGLHAVPAGDLAGPAGGAAQLPDDGDRPHRPGDRQRLDARRGHAPRPRR